MTDPTVYSGYKLVMIQKQLRFMRNDGEWRPLILFTGDLLYLSYLLTDLIKCFNVHPYIHVMIGRAVIKGQSFP